MERLFKALIILIICQTGLPAQVRLLLDYNARTATYTVSMMPERTWNSPYNKTATGQITLKATTGQFFVKDIQSHIEDTRWLSSGRVNGPIESPNYDYIFFRLKTSGLVEMPYRAFRPTKLFSFTLESNCAREVMLVNNKEDAFLPPNSRRANIGNSISVLGANGDAYAGNLSNLPIFCPYANPPSLVANVKEETNKILPSKEEESNLFIENKKLFPNPTRHLLNVQLNWKGTAGEKTILTYNTLGELVRFYKQDMQAGANQFSMDLSDLENGMYNFRIVDEERTLTLGKAIKVQ